MPTTEQTLARLARLEEDRLKYEKSKRLAARIAVGALLFSIVSSTFVWVHSARVAEDARHNAVQEADRARRESDAGLCEVLALIISSDTPSRTDTFRRALAQAYTAPGCQPPLVNDRLPKPTPTASPSAR